MTNYVKLVDFAAKDSLSSGNPAKAIKGTEINTELANVATAIATKEDTANKNAANGYVGLGASAESSISGSSTAASFIPSGSAVPTNGVYLPAANTVAWASNTTLRGSVNSTGNWVLAAPSAGVGLTVTPAAANYGISSGKLRTGDDVLATGANVVSTGTDPMWIGSIGAASAGLYTNSVQRLVASSAGNITANAATSGVTLAVSGVSGQPTMRLSEATTPYIGFNTAGGERLYIQYNEGTSEALIDSDGSLSLLSNNTRRIQLGTAGNVTINAPSSGVTASITSVSAGTPMRLTDGTVTGSFDFGGQFQIGTTSAHALSLYSNNATRVSVSSAGNVTINAASSGDELTVVGSVVATSFAGDLTGNVTGNVTGSSGSTTGNAATATALQTARTINGTSFNGTANITVTAAADTLTGTTLAALSGANLTALNASNLASGTVPSARVAGAYTAITAIGNTGSHITIGTGGGIQVGSPTGGDKGAGTVNTAGAIYQNGTLIQDSGSFTGTLGGCTTSPTGTINWSRSGSVVVLEFPTITATSNTFAMNVSGLPSALWPTATKTGIPVRVMDNGTITLGYMIIASGTGSLTFAPTIDGGSNFTTSGTKGVQQCVLTYFI